MEGGHGSEHSAPTRRNPVHFRGHHEYLSRKDKSEIEHEVRQHLSKRYDLDDDNLFTLPSGYFSSPPWKIDSLCELKENLNAVKSKLNNYDLERWHAHTASTNFAGNVVSSVRKFKPELLTQAWCKFYDIVESFPVIPVNVLNEGTLNTIHLCEAPGAFIASLNHNLILNYPHIQWNWRANTLNPYYEGNPLQRMINDDRFLMKTLDSWVFGEDYTGNICQRINIESIERTAKEIGPIHIVTADGSFDCTDDPAEQEGKVVPLFYCETIAALSMLCIGGSFVLKIFTIFECHTVCLLYLLRCVFKKVSIYKPIVSKEGNSELYVVCIGFNGKETCDGLLMELLKRMEDDTMRMAMFKKEDIHEMFLSEMERCSSFFTAIQIRVIERNISLFEEGCSSTDQAILCRIRKRIAQLFIENFCIQSLPDDGYLLGKQSYYKRGLHFSPRDETGTFAEKKCLKDNDPSALLEFYKTKLHGMHYFWPTEDNLQWLNSDKLQAEGYSPEICVRKGKPFNTIQSSRFCTGNLLTIFNDVLKNTIQVSSYDFWSEPASSFLYSRMTCLAYNEFKTVDVRDKPWISNYHSAQMECLRALRSVLQELEKGNHFVFIGLPLLTQFNVGLVFLLARNFKQIGFPCPRQVGNCIVFQDLQSTDFEEVIEVLKELEEQPEFTLISLVNITSFGDDYLSLITLLNHVLLRKTSLIMACNL